MSWECIKDSFTKKFFKMLGLSFAIYSLIFILTSVFSDSLALLLIEALPLFVGVVLPVNRVLVYAAIFIFLTVLSALVANTDDENYNSLYLITFLGMYVALSILILFFFVYGRVSNSW